MRWTTDCNYEGIKGACLYTVHCCAAKKSRTEPTTLWRTAPTAVTMVASKQQSAVTTGLKHAEISITKRRGIDSLARRQQSFRKLQLHAANESDRPRYCISSWTVDTRTAVTRHLLPHGHPSPPEIHHHRHLSPG